MSETRTRTYVVKRTGRRNRPVDLVVGDRTIRIPAVGAAILELTAAEATAVRAQPNVRLTRVP